MLLALDEGERSVGELCPARAGTAPALYHHLNRLERAGLVASWKDGQRRFYALTDAGRDMLRVIATAAGLARNRGP